LIKIEVKDRLENGAKIQGSNHSFPGGQFKEFRSFKDQIEKGHPRPKQHRFKQALFFSSSSDTADMPERKGKKS
jgi:hypothetical protein